MKERRVFRRDVLGESTGGAAKVQSHPNNEKLGVQVMNDRLAARIG